MTSKFELAISTGYVPDWGIVEAFRELFQNALDNEITNPENTMGWEYDEESQTLRVSNKTSVLPAESLLLGSSTKANDCETIGKHGEGYKIAFMVLLRNNKKIKVYNYGAKETWDVKLVKSKRYNGELLTTIFVEKEAVWKKVPNNNLTIEVSGITSGEYKDIVEKNLHLRTSTISKFKMPGRGDIILNEEESGNIYVKGLFVTKIRNLKYGYDFEPRVLGLDRDRRLVDSFNVSWEASILWQNAADKDEELKKIAVELVKEHSTDVAYVESISYNTEALYNAVADDFFDEYGDNAVPVVSNSEYDYVASKGDYKPVIVDAKTSAIIKKSTKAKDTIESVTITVREELQKFIDKIEDKLTEDELHEINGIISRVKN